MPAFDAPDRQDLLRQISHVEPVPPRRRDPAIPRDLETIVLKAMAKEPEHRYASAQELADDLGRFLDDQPIAARRPSLWRSFAMVTPHHRGVVAAGSLLLVGAMVLAGGWRRSGTSRSGPRPASRRPRRHAGASERRCGSRSRPPTRSPPGQSRWSALPGSAPGPGIGTSAAGPGLLRADRRAISRRPRDAADRRRGRAPDRLHPDDPPGRGRRGPYRRSIALYESILADTPADPELRVDLTSAYDLALLFREPAACQRRPCLLR